MSTYSLKVFNRSSSVPDYAIVPSSDVQGAPYTTLVNVCGVFPYSASQTNFVQNLVFYDSTGQIHILPPGTGYSGTTVVHTNFKAFVKKSWIEFGWCLEDDAESPDVFESAMNVEVVLFTATGSTGVTYTRIYDRVLYFDKNHPVRFEIPDISDISVNKERSVFLGVNFVPIAQEGGAAVLQSGNFTVNSEFCVVVDPQFTPSSSS